MWRGTIHYTLVWGCWILFPLFFLSSCRHKDTQTKQADQPQWIKLGPGGGGATFIPTFSYDSINKFLVRCDMTGAYLTKDGGESYQQVNFPNGSSSFAFDPHNPQTIYIGSSSLDRSADGGRTWKRIFPKTEDVEGEEFKGDHATFSFKVAAHSQYNTKSPDIHCIRVDPEKREMLYFSMGKSFYYSQDNGATFKHKDLQYPVDLIYTNKDALKDNVLVITSNSIGTFNKLSETFEEKELPDDLSPVFSFTAGVARDNNQVIIYALHHDQSKVVHEEFGYTEIWKSNDKGESWVKIDDPTINNDINKIKPSPNEQCHYQRRPLNRKRTTLTK